MLVCFLKNEYFCFVVAKQEGSRKVIDAKVLATSSGNSSEPEHNSMVVKIEEMLSVLVLVEPMEVCSSHSQNAGSPVNESLFLF